MLKIPDTILNKLKCTNCKCWVSCGPVRVLDNGGSVCGRCQLYAAVDQYRHFAYEALACYFKFPCKYWGNHCHEGLSFKEVLIHEDGCSYVPGCCFCCCHPFMACMPKRKLNINEAIRLEIVPEPILDYLRCSVCAGYLSSTPILVSLDGTSTCHRCSAQYSLAQKPEYRRHMLFETFVDMMIFPCVFRYEGCTQLYKFGEPMHSHELDCPYNINRHRGHQKQELPQKQSGQKERGVIETLTGHMYLTITPSSALYALTTAKNSSKDLFLDEFKTHKENLARKWSVHQEQIDLEATEPAWRQVENRGGIRTSFSSADVISKPPLGRSTSTNSNGDFRHSFLDELKFKQKTKRSTILNEAKSEDNVSLATAASSRSSSERGGLRRF